jgi:nucleotide-binding universal stress UspA family protein
MERKIKTVLIGTSLTEMSDPVVRAGLAVARAAGAQVMLVHAFQPQVIFGGGAPYVPDVFLEESIEAERAAVERRMAEQIARLGIPGEEIAGRRVEFGAPHRVLTEIAETSNADVVVVGSAESPRMAKMFGSTADRVVRKSLRPVLVVRGPVEMPPERVLLPVDLSPVSAEAFRRGLDLLGELSPSPALRLEALYVVAGHDPGLFGPGEAREEEVERDLDRFVTRNSFRSPHKVETRVGHGEVEDVIRARSAEWDADLIVLGTHGRGGFERFVLGSVASDVVRRGSASVLVIPPVVEAREVNPAFKAEAVPSLLVFA